MAPAPHSYFEDIETGVPFETPGLTVTEAHVALFAGLTGAGPTEPGLLPDLLPLALSSGLSWRVPTAPLVVLAFMGFEWEFLLPIRIGDTLRNRCQTLAKRALRDGGVVIEDRRIVNQRDDVVQRGKITLLVAKRPVP